MKRFAGILALSVMVGTGAEAGVTHVVGAWAASPGVPEAAVAVSPALGRLEQKTLSDALSRAGFRVVPATAPHDTLVTMKVALLVTCEPLCIDGVAYRGGTLDDYYRRYAVVSAQSNTGPKYRDKEPLSWYAVLQSDGLSQSEKNYLPSMLRAGSATFGKTVGGEQPPPLGPNFILTPGRANGGPPQG